MSNNVERLREKFKNGTRVKLVSMEGENSSVMYCGLEGTVLNVDDIGQIHVSWDNGSSLALNPEVDAFSIIDEPRENIQPVNTIRVIKVEPGDSATVVEIEPTLESYQSVVDGYIEALYPYDDPVAIICNDEGKLTGKHLNRALRDSKGNIYDVIAGTFIIAGLTDDDFGSVPDEYLQKYLDKFYRPEAIFSVNGQIVAIPID